MKQEIDVELLGIMRGFCWACIYEWMEAHVADTLSVSREDLETEAVEALGWTRIAAVQHETGYGLCLGHLRQAADYMEQEAARDDQAKI